MLKALCDSKPRKKVTYNDSRNPFCLIASCPHFCKHVPFCWKILFPVSFSSTLLSRCWEAHQGQLPAARALFFLQGRWAELRAETWDCLTMGGGREKGLGKTTVTIRHSCRLARSIADKQVRRFQYLCPKCKSYLLQLPLQLPWCSCSRQEIRLQNFLEPLSFLPGAPSKSWLQTHFSYEKIFYATSHQQNAVVLQQLYPQSLQFFHCTYWTCMSTLFLSFFDRYPLL